MNLTLDLNKISQYRTPLMGISAILIILCHANLYDIKVNSLIHFLLTLGNVGVDIFLFLSGIGCYYSLQNGVGYQNWYKKRLVRIFVPYALTQIPYWGFYIIKGNFDLIDSLYEFSTIAFWVRHTGMWYIALLIPLYLLTPFLYKLLESTSHRIKLAVVLMVSVLVLCNLDIYTDNHLAMNIIKNVQWAFGRTVSFIFGMAIAPAVKQGVKVNGLYIVLATVVLIPTLRFLSFGWYWCLFAIMIFCFVKYLDILPSKGKAYSFLQFMGIISLESYIFNGYVRYMFMDSSIYTSNSIWLYGHYLDYFMIFIIGTMLSYMVNQVSTKLINKI